MQLAWLSPHFQLPPSFPTRRLCPFRCSFSGAWACVCTRIQWVPPMDSPVKLEVSPTAATPTGLTARGLKALVSCIGILGCMVCLAPPLFSWLICMQMRDFPVRQPHLTCPIHQPLSCSMYSLPQLLVSAPPTSQDECFFNSLVFRLPYSLIFWQFWLFLF